MIDNVPRNAIIQKRQDESENRGTSSNKNSGGLSIQIKNVYDPRSSSIWFFLQGTIGRVVLGATCRATKERWCE
tara:strand:- start:112 stop:333 length:222 start_codon:yes stop_codon:yes gene_type:complete